MQARRPEGLPRPEPGGRSPRRRGDEGPGRGAGGILAGLLLVAMLAGGAAAMAAAPESAGEAPAELREVMQRVAEAYSRRDIPGLLACFAPDPEAVHIGTDAYEWLVGLPALRESYRLFFADFPEVRVAFPEVRGRIRGEMAWLAAQARVRLKSLRGEEFDEASRFTAVLERRGDKWLIVQSHFSFPAR